MTLTGISSNTVQLSTTALLLLRAWLVAMMRSKGCDVTPFGGEGRTFSVENAFGSVLNPTLSKYINE